MRYDDLPSVTRPRYGRPPAGRPSQVPGAHIERDNVTGRWGAIEHPTGGGEIFTHAPTLAELDIKLGAESSEAG